MLLENMSYPEIGEKYEFNCFKTNLSFKDDERTLDDSYPITMEYSMRKIMNNSNVESKNYSYNNLVGNSINSRVAPGIDIVGPGDGEDTINDSFSNAALIDVNQSRNIIIVDYYDRYYKINRNTLDYISVYSTGNVDVKVYLYDSSYNLLGSNDNVGTSGRGTNFTSGNNFFLNFYADKNTTYYLKIVLNSGDSGYINFFVSKDNWANSNLENLLWQYDGVDDEYKVDYEIESSYVSEINYGINEWNKLGSVTFQPDTSSTVNDIIISDYTDSETGAAVAVTTYRALLEMKVEYNVAYFQGMTTNERIKTVLHEFGHVLGLTEFTNLENSATNVMHQGIRDITHLGPADIAAYRYKWG